MFTVALIGPDGAGKTTVAKHLMVHLPLPVKYLYMGVNNEASNRILPTTSVIRALKRACGAKPDVAGPPELRPEQTKSSGTIKNLARTMKSLLSLCNRLCEEWYRQLLTWSYQWRGYIVLYDRHYFVDYFAYDVAQSDWKRPLARRIHGFLLDRVYPKPDLVIYLDAPSEVLFARKGEGTIEALERRRRDYLELRGHVGHFIAVDGNRPLDQVTRDVTDTIIQFHQRRKGAKTSKLERYHGNFQAASASSVEQKS